MRAQSGQSWTNESGAACLVVQVVEGQPGGAELVAGLQQAGPVLPVQPAQQTGVGHRLAHLQTQMRGDEERIIIILLL